MNSECPEQETFADFLEGRLTEQQRSSLEKHVAACDRCLELVAVSSGVINNSAGFDPEPVPGAVTDAAVRLVQGQVGDRRTSLGQRVARATVDLYTRAKDFTDVLVFGMPATAPIRGSKQQVAEDLIRLRKTFRELDTELEIEKVGPNLAHIRARLMGKDRQEKGIRATIVRDDREIASQLIDGGYALFEDVVFGRYCIRFGRDGRNIGEFFFEIRESGNDG